MKKISIALILFFALLIAFASVAIAQMTEKGWKKTVTLQSGEVILDMSGEWERTTEFYGVFWFIESVPGDVKFTQEGTTFTGVRQTATKWKPKGSEAIKGELDKDGFKAVYANIGSAAMDGSFEWAECKWKISEKGNKVNLDCGERAKMTLTRK
jgi:hypothetical protein